MTKPLIVVTGASSGIGAAVAKSFSDAGHPLLLLARRLDRLEALNLPNTICKQVDMTNRSQILEAVEEAEQQYGPVDGFVNNAGCMLLGEVATQNPEEWDQMVDVNVKGVLNGIHAVLAGMIERNSGSIINVSSLAGRKTFPFHAAYCGTKFAVHAISENLREEVCGHNVRLITIAPGAVETELLSHTTSEEIKDTYEGWKKDMDGALRAEDVANAVIYAYQQPQNVNVREIVLAATKQTG
ncbi:SDR family oxidoreductase [Flexibacterium corallicola]|uniref:SDR family oxidoreductase n=1 Tax=Flexibacterium corallicola TaxID=3037259 RepID=UPI00286EF313|nr:SDR family oxidoreductase [Pseudovibrio sp. M1P-2-3]